MTGAKKNDKNPPGVIKLASVGLLRVVGPCLESPRETFTLFAALKSVLNVLNKTWETGAVGKI